MFRLWIFLSLLLTSFVLKSCAGVINPAVSLNCNHSVEVTAGENVTLTCYIKYRTKDDDCKGSSYEWSNSHGTIPCHTGNMEYNCEWDSVTYMSLTIPNVKKGENYTVSTVTDCGVADSSVRVRVKGHPSTPGPTTTTTMMTATTTIPTRKYLFHIVVPIFLILIVALCILLVLYRKLREIVKSREAYCKGSVFPE